MCYIWDIWWYLAKLPPRFPLKIRDPISIHFPSSSLPVTGAISPPAPGGSRPKARSCKARCRRISSSSSDSTCWSRRSGGGWSTWPSPNGQTTPPPDIRPLWWGLINHWFPFKKAGYETLISGGGGTLERGGRLTRHTLIIYPPNVKNWQKKFGKSYENNTS